MSRGNKDLRELLEKATPAPWKHDDRGHIHAAKQQFANIFVNDEMEDRPVARFGAWENPTSYPRDWHNAALIVALRNAAPDLLRVVEAAQAVNDDMRSGCGIDGRTWKRLQDALEALK